MGQDKVQEQLTEHNWRTWAEYAMCILRLKRLSRMVDASEPPVPKDVEDADLQARSLIILNISTHMVQHVSGLKTAKEVWDQLQKVCTGSLRQRGNQLHAEFTAFKQQHGETLVTAAARMVQLGRDLQQAEIQIKPEQMALRFLMGLEQRHYSNAQAILAAGSVRNMDDVLQRLTSMELLQDAMGMGSEPGAAMAAQFRGQQGRGGGAGGGSRKPLECFNCGKQGHPWRKCPSPLKESLSKKLNGGKGGSKGKGGDSGGATASKGMAMFARGRSVWHMDSGSTYHVTPSKELLSNYVTLPPGSCQVEVGDGVLLDAAGYGDVRLEVTDVRAAKRGAEIRIKGSTMHVMGGRQVDVPDEDGAFTLHSTPATGAALIAASSKAEGQLWHHRLAHRNYTDLERMASKGMVTGLTATAADFKAAAAADGVCEPCELGKRHAQPFGEAHRHETEVMGRVHMDLWGPRATPALVSGARYECTFLDEASGMSAQRFVRTKDEVPGAVMDQLLLWEVQSGKKLKGVRTDRGTEFVNSTLNDFYADRGVTPEKSAPGTPQQNGRAERLNGTLNDAARTMLVAAGLTDKKSLWQLAKDTACYIRNRIPAAGKDRTPCEIFYGHKPDVSHLRVFGCTAYAKPPTRGDKLAPVREKGVMVGYAKDSKAYRILTPDWRVVERRDCTFDESSVISGDAAVGAAAVGAAAVPVPGGAAAVGADSDSDSDSGSVDGIAAPVGGEGDGAAVAAGGAAEGSAGAGGAAAGTAAAGGAADGGAAATTATQGHANAEGSDRRITRSLARTAAQGSTTEQADGRYPGRQRNHPERFVSYVAASSVTVPKTQAEAYASPFANDWQDAECAEVASLHSNKTWTLEYPPEGSNVIKTMFVYDVKTDAKGEIERFKARLVAKGCSQRPGVDFTDTFAPVGKATTLRTMLSLAAAQDWELRQLDIKTAFLNGELREDVWVTQPPGYEEGLPGQVCHLHKALYGLRQAPHAWHEKLVTEMGKLGFAASDVDPGLFVKHSPKGRSVWVLVWVDDMIVGSPSAEAADETTAAIKSVFDTRDLGEPNKVLGMLLERDREAGTIKLSQQQYVMELAELYGLKECARKATPMSPAIKLSKLRESDEPLDTSQFQYSALVGALNYLATWTRPDIAQSVGALARYMANPGKEHWTVARGVLRYLVTTADYGLCYSRAAASDLLGFCDSDFAGDPDTRRSTTGHVFILNGAAVGWQSRRQPTVAASTTEAEYMAAGAAVKEAIWERQLHQHDFELSTSAVPIKCDNQTAIRLLTNPISAARTKHIDVMHHFVRERVQRQEVSFQYVETTRMLADCMTKALPEAQFVMCRNGMGVRQ